MTEEYLKENTPLDDNIDSKLLRTSMREGQDIYIRDLIGSGIYDELCTQIIADPDMSNYANNKTLLTQYIQPCLKYYILYECAQTLSFQLVNKGIVTRNSEWQSPADINSITALMTKWRDKGEYYAKRLQDYLCENHTTYPLYYNPGSAADTIHPRSTFLYSGLYLGDDPENSRGYDKPV